MGLLAMLPWHQWQIWHAVPLVVAISLVYAGTRHERMLDILWQGYHTAVWLVCFMCGLFAVIWLLSTQV